MAEKDVRAGKSHATRCSVNKRPPLPTTIQSLSILNSLISASTSPAYWLRGHYTKVPLKTPGRTSDRGANCMTCITLLSLLIGQDLAGKAKDIITLEVLGIFILLSPPSAAAAGRERLAVHVQALALFEKASRSNAPPANGRPVLP